MENKQDSTEEKRIIYKVADEEVKLSESIVQQFLVRGGKPLSRSEVANFIQLCKYRKLNPFLNEAYAIKFKDEPAQLVVGADAFKRKAEENANFAGYKAGIIIMRAKEIKFEQGAFKLPTDTLVGGWAEVYLKDREFPVVARVNFSEYNKNQSTWKQIPCTMIRKVALVQALREAFPLELGSMYSGEELGVEEKQNTTKNIVHEEIQENANKIDFNEKIIEENVEVVKAEDVAVIETKFIEVEDSKDGIVPF